MSKAIYDLLKNAVALNGKVVIEVVEKEEKKTESGLWLAGEAVNQAMEHFRIGKVISSGFSEVQKDDNVVYLRFHGDEAGENIIVLDSKDIIAKY